MNYTKLKTQFDAEEGTFLLSLRGDLKWDKSLFKTLTSEMFKVAASLQEEEEIPTWIANGFWFCDTWVKEWTMHEGFPQPDQEYYDASLELLHDLAYFLFNKESPYVDDTLKVRANG